MRHTTADEWSEEFGDNTQIFLRQRYDIYSKTDVFELVLGDKSDSRCIFWFRGSLSDIGSLADKIRVLIAEAHTSKAKCT